MMIRFMRELAIMHDRVMIANIDVNMIRIDGYWGYWDQWRVLLDILGSDRPPGAPTGLPGGGDGVWIVQMVSKD